MLKIENFKNSFSEVKTNIDLAGDTENLRDGYKTTCLTLISSTQNFWKLQFTIDEYLQSKVSELEVRLHQQQKFCKFFDIIFLQSEATKCVKYFKTCTYKYYSEGSSNSYDGPYCSFSCLCKSDICSTLSISLLESQSQQLIELCSITWYMREEKNISEF